MNFDFSPEMLRGILIAIPGILIAVTYHEAAHAWMADKCGDHTARSLGRVSANPLRHVDPIGTIIVPLLLYMTSGFVFGWAKPVPVVESNFHKPRRDMILTALAGPVTNFGLALLCTSLYHILLLIPQGPWSEWLEPILLAAQVAVFINVLLGVFNMIPVPPLDGGRVAMGLLPPRQSIALAKLERFGIIIVIALLLFPPTRMVFGIVFSVINIVFIQVIPNLRVTVLNWLAEMIHRLI